MHKVALLTEGVDRNSAALSDAAFAYTVALLAEGVDRNCYVLAWKSNRMGSPSSRRAWIEISRCSSTLRLALGRPPPASQIALLTESIHQILSPSGCTHHPFCRPVIDSAGDSLFPYKPAAGPRSAIPPLVFFVSALFYRHPPCRRRKMPPARVSTLAISFSCTTADRYPLWQ